MGLLGFEWVAGIRRSNRMEPWVGPACVSPQAARRDWGEPACGLPASGKPVAVRLDPSMRSSLSLEREMRILFAILDQVFISLPTLFLEEPKLVSAVRCDLPSPSLGESVIAR